MCGSVRKLNCHRITVARRAFLLLSLSLSARLEPGRKGHTHNTIPRRRLRWRASARHGSTWQAAGLKEKNYEQERVYKDGGGVVSAGAAEVGR